MEGSSKVSGFAVASLILGLLGLIPYTFGIFSVIALAFAVIALLQMKKNSAIAGKGLAVGGIVLSGIGLIVVIVLIVIGLNIHTVYGSAACQKANFGISKMNNETQFFYNATTKEMRFLLQNVGKVDVAGVDVRVIGDKGVQENEFDLLLKINDLKWYNFVYDDESNGLIKEIRIYPVVLNADNSSRICAQYIPLRFG